MKHTRSTALLAAALLGPAAAAQPITLTVDPAQSVIDVSIELATALGNRTDSDSSPVVGFATIELEPSPAFASITLTDYSFAAQDTLSFVFDYGFLGSVTATGAGIGLELPVGGAATTGLVDGAGAFSLIGVPTQTIGTITSTGTGIVGAGIGTIVTDLGANAPASLDTAGTITVVGDTVTLAITVPLSVSEVVADGITATVTGSATLIATGTIPPTCLPDVNGNGALDPGDFTAWVAAYNAQDPAADQNSDGLIDPSDFSAWVANFNAGC
ncbi:MAG: GC-type dockerin domain-anchored protein [Phycisphaerales bacterium]